MSDKSIKFYGPNVESNKKNLQYIHDVMCLSLGVGAGVLSLESLYGFLFYIVGMTLTNVGFIIVCCEGKPKEFYRNPLQQIFLDGLQGNIAGFVMMWCLVYALVK
ncbi:ER membrane protein complex subunit 6 [[Candida] jaroonii]|uniref:ER membrane protein complex subunit 6 n=1 Tax=[Candida] jaroonii TaxID=467808 RepID=A0ACA9YBQ2_9ASCO|nr:ER membrane protein complex subunit 6 [[Candida] jaroonii]